MYFPLYLWIWIFISVGISTDDMCLLLCLPIWVYLNEFLSMPCTFYSVYQCEFLYLKEFLLMTRTFNSVYQSESIWRNFYRWHVLSTLYTNLTCDCVSVEFSVYHLPFKTTVWINALTTMIALSHGRANTKSLSIILYCLHISVLPLSSSQCANMSTLKSWKANIYNRMLISLIFSSIEVIISNIYAQTQYCK